MVPFGTSQLGKMRIYNSTRGTYALISNCVTGTNTLTLTAAVPAGWQVGDTLTIASNICSVGGQDWVDIEITSGPTDKSALFVMIVFASATTTDAIRLQPYEAFSNSKNIIQEAIVASANMRAFGLLPITSNLFCLSWSGTPTTLILREAGNIT
jgi:hypothetical protein